MDKTRCPNGVPLPSCQVVTIVTHLYLTIYLAPRLLVGIQPVDPECGRILRPLSVLHHSRLDELTGGISFHHLRVALALEGRSSTCSWWGVLWWELQEELRLVEQKLVELKLVECWFWRRHLFCGRKWDRWGKLSVRNCHEIEWADSCGPEACLELCWCHWMLQKLWE